MSAGLLSSGCNLQAWSADAINGAPSGSSHIIDTGILGRREVYWIDDERVLFPGYDRTRSSAIGSASAPQPVLYIYNLTTREAQIVADIPEADHVCYSDGFVSYAVSRAGERYIREGMLGAEVNRKPTESRPGRKIQLNELTCKEFDLAAADKVYPGFWFVPLREKEGYYGGQKKESFVQASESPMFYLPNGANRRPIALPIRLGEKDRISYSKYLGAYVIEYTPSAKNQNTIGRMSVLDTKGKVTGFNIPAGPWMRGSVGYAPSKKGVIISSTALGRRSRHDPGDAGIYLVAGNSVKRLLTGFPGRPVAPSPDGCKIAAIVDSYTAPETRATLRIIDICEQAN